MKTFQWEKHQQSMVGKWVGFVEKVDFKQLMLRHVSHG